MPYFEVFAKYAEVGVRATRREYWMFQIVNGAIRTGLAILAFTVSSWIFSPLAIYVAATFLPGWAVSVRRLHDTGRSG